MMKVLEIAVEHPGIRAVFQTGSRVNPVVSRDIMQDYDIIYCVKDVQTFIEPQGFLEKLGNPILVHTPHPKTATTMAPEKTHRLFALYEEGFSVDFIFYPVEDISELIAKETLLLILMDKDNLISQLPGSSDIGYRVTRPTKYEFAKVVEIYFYQITQTVKHLYRANAVAAIDEYDGARDALHQMLAWVTALEKDFKINVGKNYRFLDENLNEEWREIYHDTFSSLDPTTFWEALLKSMTLFRRTGLEVAESLSFEYPKQQDVRVSAYVRKIWQQYQRTDYFRG